MTLVIIIWATGFIVSYFILKASFIKDVCHGDRNNYTVDDRGAVLFMSIPSLVSVLAGIIALLLTRSNNDEKANW